MAHGMVFMCRQKYERSKYLADLRGQPKQSEMWTCVNLYLEMASPNLLQATLTKFRECTIVFQKHIRALPPLEGKLNGVAIIPSSFLAV